MNAADLFIKALENEGVEVIYGVPREENLDLLKALRKSSIEFPKSSLRCWKAASTPVAFTRSISPLIIRRTTGFWSMNLKRWSA